ncbi:MAG: hypothetical protein M3070_06970 [Actinomycetota bacterium]|nr:hypothetical protein [Actinomycetota bacterium]
MIWWLILLVLMGFGAYLLRAFAKHADDIEDDSAHLYQNRTRSAYGSKFLNILRGRDD